MSTITRIDESFYKEVDVPEEEYGIAMEKYDRPYFDKNDYNHTITRTHETTVKFHGNGISELNAAIEDMVQYYTSKLLRNCYFDFEIKKHSGEVLYSYSMCKEISSTEIISHSINVEIISTIYLLKTGLMSMRDFLQLIAVVNECKSLISVIAKNLTNGSVIIFNENEFFDKSVVRIDDVLINLERNTSLFDMILRKLETRVDFVDYGPIDKVDVIGDRLTYSSKEDRTILPSDCEFKIGDLLCYGMDGKLTNRIYTDEKGLAFPIAICVHIDGKRYEFMGLQFLTPMDVGGGRTKPIQRVDLVLFGLYEKCLDTYHTGSRILRSTKSTYITNGAEMYFKNLLDCTSEYIIKRGNKVTTDMMRNDDIESTFSPLAYLCYKYKTPGTTEGMWYIPTLNEFKFIMEWRYSPDLVTDIITPKEDSYTGRFVCLEVISGLVSETADVLKNHHLATISERGLYHIYAYNMFKNTIIGQHRAMLAYAVPFLVLYKK